MTSLTRATAPALLVLALALTGCTTASLQPSATAEPQVSADGCADVTVVVEFGPLDESPIELCASAGVGTDVLDASGITTEGTVDYGDQVVCRVNDQPSSTEEVTLEGQAPFVESCQSLNSLAYWALWVKTAPDSEWEYAQEGLTTLQLTAGQSLGLVYTPGTESISPSN